MFQSILQQEYVYKCCQKCHNRKYSPHLQLQQRVNSSVKKIIDSQYTHALQSKVYLLRIFVRSEKAIQYTDKGVAKELQDYVSLCIKSYLLRMLDRFEEAIQYTGKAIAIDYENQVHYILDVTQYVFLLDLKRLFNIWQQTKNIIYLIFLKISFDLISQKIYIKFK